MNVGKYITNEETISILKRKNGKNMHNYIQSKDFPKIKFSSDKIEKRDQEAFPKEVIEEKLQRLYASEKILNAVMFISIFFSFKT